MNFKIILKNITFITWVNQFSGLIGSILVLPVLISNYSPEYIALWLFMQSVISFGMLGDSGFGSTLTRSVASLKSGALSVSSENLAKGNILFSSPEIIQEKLSNILHTSKYIYGFLSIISFVLVLLYGYFGGANIFSFIKDQNLTMFCLLASSFTCLFQLLNVRLTSFLKGIGKITIEKNIDTFINITKNITLLVLLLFSANFYLLFIVLILGQLLKNIIIYIKLKSLNLNNTNKPIFDKQLFRELLIPSWKLGVMNIGAFLITQSSILVISQIDDKVLIASYLLTYKVLFFLYSFFISPVYSHIPIFSKLYVEKKTKVLTDKISLLFISNILLFILVSILFLYFGGYLISLIKTDILFLDHSFTLIIIITLTLELIHSMFATVYLSTNKVPFLIPAILSGIIITLLSFYLVPDYGLLGVLFSQFIVQLCFNNWYPIYLFRKKFNIQIRTLIKNFPGVFIQNVKANYVTK